MTKTDPDVKTSWSDLYRLLPYVRQSLSCSVCGEILKHPYTPIETGCQHHVCMECRGSRKRIKPVCNLCKDTEGSPDCFTENHQLRILVQSYKKMCLVLVHSAIYPNLLEQEDKNNSSGLVELIQEAVNFSDDDYNTDYLWEHDYSSLPNIYNSSNKEPQYSVMFAGTGNKITIKRKLAEDEIKVEPLETEPVESENENSMTSESFKMPNHNKLRSSSKRKGCRCGNATPTPGKLTCCGQRCPCYVESKACMECKCKGCRNPHRADGLKVCPHITVADTDGNIMTLNSDDSRGSNSGSTLDSLPLDVQIEEGMEFSTEIEPSTSIKVYSNELGEVTAALPNSIMMDEDDQMSNESPNTDENWPSSPKPCSSSGDEENVCE